MKLAGGDSIETEDDIGHIAAHFHALQKNEERKFKDWMSSIIRFQKTHNEVYQRFTGFTYLPVQAFKEAPVCCFIPSDAERVFVSSGTSLSTPAALPGTSSNRISENDGRARHYVRDLEVYDRSIVTGFNRVFGDGPFIILAHLPHYRPESSLVYMVQKLIESFGSAGSGFFLEDQTLLESAILVSNRTQTPILLFGAAFGLLDLVEQRRCPLPSDAKVIETGGMKTHRREITRSDLHARLALGFGVERAAIRSEYGMCEMLSQCYTSPEGFFQAPPWVKIEVLDQQDFKTPLGLGKPGVLAVFDMANMYSQSAILTQDLAVLRESGFEVLGRLDQSGIRGCNLLLES
ncbi:MAG: acyl transferase [Bacteroidetes bacterium]|nr:acyl transferase [Bacteroidota bacterium]